jgi:hypothetical protein
MQAIFSTVQKGTILTGLAILTLLFTVYSIHATSKVTTSYDSGWAIYVSRSILHEGNVNLNEYRRQIRARKRYGVRKINGNFYNFFPVGSSLLALPVVALFEAMPEYIVSTVPGFPRAALRLREDGIVPNAANAHIEMERASTSIFIALTAMFVFLTARCFLSASGSFLLGLIFAFCTPAWSTGSRALWPHAPTMLLLSATVYLLVKAKKKPSLSQYAALPLALSFVVRPSNIVSILFFSCYVAFTHREYFLRFIGWGLLIAGGFVLFNYEIHGKVIPKYYRPGRIRSHPHLLEALAANLVSPSRGIFVFSPVFLLAFIAPFRAWVLQDSAKLVAYLIAICVFHTLLVSSFPNWWGGHAYGPRYMSDLCSYLTLLLIPFVHLLEQSRKRWLYASVMLLLLIPSFLLNKIGATRQTTLFWNVIPRNIDEDQSRVWDWHDPQFLRFSTKPRR